jgi:hypothetical protein
MADAEPMRIGSLARRTGVSVKTLRFYDSQELLFRAGPYHGQLPPLPRRSHDVRRNYPDTQGCRD